MTRFSLKQYITNRRRAVNELRGSNCSVEWWKWWALGATLVYPPRTLTVAAPKTAVTTALAVVTITTKQMKRTRNKNGTTQGFNVLRHHQTIVTRFR